MRRRRTPCRSRRSRTDTGTESTYGPTRAAHRSAWSRNQTRPFEGPSLLPFEGPLPPGVDQLQGQNDQETQHFDEPGPSELTEHRSPRVEKDGFDVEHHEQDRGE